MIQSTHIDRALLNRMLAANTLYVPETHVFRVKPYILGTFGTGDVQTTRDPLWFLTDRDGLCTGTWHARVFDHYKVPYGSGFPLTAQEDHFITSDPLALERYPSDLWMGYSAWWRNQKWFCPMLEFCYEQEEGNPLFDALHLDPLADVAVLRAFVRSEAERLFLALHVTGEETVLLDFDSNAGRFRLYLCVPMRVVCEGYDSLQAWQSYLSALFPYEAGALAVGTAVYIDGGCFAHDRHADACECGEHNANCTSFGCSVYDLSDVPGSPIDEESFRDWLQDQEPICVVWGSSEDAAYDYACRYCDRLGYRSRDLAV
jgi:hypothetical protein